MLTSNIFLSHQLINGYFDISPVLSIFLKMTEFYSLKLNNFPLYTCTGANIFLISHIYLNNCKTCITVLKGRLNFVDDSHRMFTGSSLWKEHLKWHQRPPVRCGLLCFRNTFIWRETTATTMDSWSSNWAGLFWTLPTSLHSFLEGPKIPYSLTDDLFLF